MNVRFLSLIGLSCLSILEFNNTAISQREKEIYEKFTFFINRNAFFLEEKQSLVINYTSFIKDFVDSSEELEFIDVQYVQENDEIFPIYVSSLKLEVKYQRNFTYKLYLLTFNLEEKQHG